MEVDGGGRWARWMRRVDGGFRWERCVEEADERGRWGKEIVEVDGAGGRDVLGGGTRWCEVIGSGRVIIKLAKLMGGRQVVKQSSNSAADDAHPYSSPLQQN